jgi:hypothetical protein
VGVEMTAEDMNKIIKQMNVDKAMANKEHWGVHESHCCPKHGCKYGDNDCPVVLGLTDKHSNHCETCEWEYEDPDPLYVLYAWLQNHEQVECNPAKHLDAVPYYSGICCEATYAKDMIRRLQTNPRSVIEEGRTKGWLK